MAGYISRWEADLLAKALSFQRIAVVVGPRQSGKTTMVKSQMPVPSLYRSLDDAGVLENAAFDSKYFVRAGGEKCLVIDEIQKLPELIGEVKMRVDEDNRPAQFVLTGSADYRSLPHVTDSLAGRSIIVRLRGFTEAEIQKCSPVFLERAFKQDFPLSTELAPCGREDIYFRILKGGYPQVQALPDDMRGMFFKSYLEAQVSHDLSENWDLNRFGSLNLLLHYFAVYSSKLVNIREVCSRLGTTHPTVRNYLNALKAMFLIDELPAWLHKDYDIGSKVPKLFMTDTGLMAYLLRIHHVEDLLENPVKTADVAGKLMETWVYNQLMPEIELHYDWQISHLRNGNRQEIDFMVENGAGHLLGIEVKSSETVRADDARHLKWFAKRAKSPFTGIVIYAGSHVLSFGDGCYAVPYSAFWEGRQ